MSFDLIVLIVANEMVQRGVDEKAECSCCTFASLMQREHPPVLRRAAESWRGSILSRDAAFLGLSLLVRFAMLRVGADA